jgi:hypothetical protein
VGERSHRVQRPFVSVPWPRCGDETPHPAHPQSGFGMPDCPGWTKEQQLVRHLIFSVNEYVQEHYNPYGRLLLPDGIRLEMHPAVRYALMRDLDLWERPGRETVLEDWFPVPVKVTTDLAKDQWRLVIVTEEVLMLGGRMPPEPPVDYSDDPAMTGRKQR